MESRRFQGRFVRVRLPMNLPIADCGLRIADCVLRHGSWSQCVAKGHDGSPLNLKRLALEMNDLGRTGSWVQSASKSWRSRLSMNLGARTVMTPTKEVGDESGQRGNTCS